MFFIVLGIENYRIYDFDILKDEDFNRALNKFIPNTIKNNYIELRKSINSEIINKNEYNNLGIRSITDKSKCNELNIMFEELKKRGIIILKNGCLETNLEDVGILFTTNKNGWFSNAIKLINSLLEEQIEDTYIYKWIFK